MAVDKSLFLYDLAVVAIMKNEAPYVKEWVEYHLLAGVNHFYIYDNESPDNLKEVLQPYINAGIVTYIFYPGKSRQMESYNNAVHKFKFLSRYMAFIDGDEFIFPQNNKSIVEVLDEIFEKYPNVGGLGINQFDFGSNGQQKADYSKGVLERFTRRASVDWALENFTSTINIKSITNPRKVKIIPNPHFAVYFENFHAVNENGDVVPSYLNKPPTVDKMILNHYQSKSFEEYEKKVKRGNADHFNNHYVLKNFELIDRNEVFDDRILKYRANRYHMDGGIIHPTNYAKCYSALLQNLSMTFVISTPRNFYIDKLETFLTCRKLIEHMNGKILDENSKKLLEEAALNAIYKSLIVNTSIADLRLLFEELPNILTLNYPVVQDIRKVCINILPQFMNIFRVNNYWQGFNELEYLLNMLKTFDSYKHA